MIYKRHFPTYACSNRGFTEVLLEEGHVASANSCPFGSDLVAGIEGC